MVDVADRVVARGAISANGRRNVTLRPNGANEMYFTGRSTLRGHPLPAVARVRLDRSPSGGRVAAGPAADVAMHTAMYEDHPDVGCVIHTHSPCATAYAVARCPIGCRTKALAMLGLVSGVAVAAYGPRGSDQALANIRAAADARTPAVLLANHGCWCPIAPLSWPLSSAG